MPCSGRAPARRSGSAAASAACRTAHTPTPRSSWAASSTWSCPPSTPPSTGPRAARPRPAAPWRSARSTACSPVAVDTPSIERIIEAVVRDSYGRLVSFLAARSRDVASAEDALGEAFVAALRAWPRDGVPDRPEAWLLKAARHRLIDRARYDRVRADG